MPGSEQIDGVPARLPQGGSPLDDRDPEAVAVQPVGQRRTGHAGPTDEDIHLGLLPSASPLLDTSWTVVRPGAAAASRRKSSTWWFVIAQVAHGAGNGPGPAATNGARPVRRFVAFLADRSISEWASLK